MGHTIINHKAAAIAADGGQGGSDSGSRDRGKDSGRGGSGDIGNNSFGNDGGRQQREQITINQKAAEWRS